MACCYENCTNTRKKNPNLTFFRFPKEKERRYLWMKKCNNNSIQNLSFEELQNRVVCEEHFLPKCFDYSVLTSGKTRRSLFKFAVPQPASVIAASKPDLVSPQSLMNITENLCLLVPPISPPPPNLLASDSSDNLDWTMKTPIQNKEDHLCFESEETEKNCLNISGCAMMMPTLTSTVTMTTAVTSASVTSTSAILNFPSKDCMPKKYKKILPKQEITDEKSNFVLFHSSDDVVTAENIVLNLRGLNIKKLEKSPKGTSTSKTTTLLLDDNLLQTLPTIDSYSRLTELSLANNEIDSFIWFGRLTCLRTLNLSRNKITEIDGLWKLFHLTRVDLSGNMIEFLKAGQMIRKVI
ncbi:UNVERIFIED_CONTAM: hypothetical protein RMT77_017383 [Armadillidium vulgare]